MKKVTVIFLLKYGRLLRPEIQFLKNTKVCYNVIIALLMQNRLKGDGNKIQFSSASLKISVSNASDKMSGVFGLGSDIFEMMMVALVTVCGKLDLNMVNVVHL